MFMKPTRADVIAKQRPIVIITSNSERAARCFFASLFFHYIDFQVVKKWHKLSMCITLTLNKIYCQALEMFFNLRDVGGVEKPSTSELLDWLKLLILKILTLKHCDKSKKVA